MACCIEINRKKDSRHRAIWRDAGISYSVPFLSQEEVADIPVLDPVSAHIELIEENNVLRKVIADAVIANLSVITDKILQFTRAIRKSASLLLSVASQLIFAHKTTGGAITAFFLKTHSTAPQLSAALPPSPYPGTVRRERSF